MKTVFILGAGASKTAGAPLMYNFLDRAHDLFRLKDDGIQDAMADFEDVFDAINELQRVYANSRPKQHRGCLWGHRNGSATSKAWKPKCKKD